jgi:hypothetical protein
MRNAKTAGWIKTAAAIFAVAAAFVANVGLSVGAGATAPPALTITPGPYHNLQKITVSVGPNKFFTPYSRINIIECADAGGSAKHLPTSVLGCDGNTIQGNTVLVQRDGSFAMHGYQLFTLPNKSLLGEDPASKPACGPKKSCVLYIGQNQEKFTAPKMFSTPFTISSSGGRTR